MARFRILQIFFNSAMLIAVLILTVNGAAKNHWRLSEITDDVAALMFSLIIALVLLNSIRLNIRLVQNTALRVIIPPSKLLPQLAILTLSIDVLYLITKQGIPVHVYFDSHLYHHYDLIFLLPAALRKPESFWLDDGISITGDGTQVVIFFVLVMTANLLVGIYATGLLTSRTVTESRFLSPILVWSHITVGFFVSLWAIAGFTELYQRAQAFTDALELDPGLMNSSNVARLLYLLFCYTFLALYAQWILRDGLKLARILKGSRQPNP